MQETTTDTTDSILANAEAYLESLTKPNVDTDLVNELISLFRRNSTLTNNNALLPTLESITARALLLLAEYVLLLKKNPPDTQTFEAWLKRCLELELFLTHFRQNTSPERLLAQTVSFKVLIFICALKAHIQHIAKKEPGAVVSSVYQFACTLQEYINYEEYTKIKLNNIATEARRLFYDVQKENPLNIWSQSITQIINHSIGAITIGEEYTDEDRIFIGYIVCCFTEETPFDHRLRKKIPDFNFEAFQRNVLAEIAQSFLTTKTGLSKKIQGELTIFGRLKFLHTQLQSLTHTAAFPVLESLSAPIRLHLPALYVYFYFLRSTEYYFLGMDPLTYKEFTANGMTKTFLQRLCIASEPDHFNKLMFYFDSMIYSDGVDIPIIRHLHLYLMMERTNDKNPIVDALKKITIDESNYKKLKSLSNKKDTPLKDKMDARFNVMMRNAIATLNMLFSEDKNKKATVSAFLAEAKMFYNDWKVLSFPIAFFLICKKSLELNDPELTPQVHNALESYYYAILNKPRPEPKKTIPCKRDVLSDKAAEARLLAELCDEKPETTKTKKKKTHKKKSTTAKPPKVAPPVSQRPPKSEPEPTSPSRTFPSLPDTETEKKSPSTPLRVLTALSEQPSISRAPSPASLRNYLKKHFRKFVSYEKLSEQDENSKIKTRSPFNLLDALMALFNQHATESTDFKFALFLFGSAQHRQRYFSYPVFANDIDFKVNCTFEELIQFLSAHENTLGFTTHVVYGKHPVVKVKFSAGPSVVLDMSPLRNEENHDQKLHALITTFQASLDFPENTVFSTIVDGEEIFIDTQGGLVSLRTQKNRELRLVTQSHEGEAIPITLLRAIRFLAKCPDYTLHPSTLIWTHDHKKMLSTQKENRYAELVSHAFVKMLYSGKAARGLTLLKDYDLLKMLSPDLDARMSGEEKSQFIIWVENFDGNHSAAFQQRPFKEYSNTCREILGLFKIQLETLNVFLNNSLWKSSSTIYTSPITHTGEQNGIGKQDRRSDFGSDGPK